MTNDFSHGLPQNSGYHDNYHNVFQDFDFATGRVRDPGTQQAQTGRGQRAEVNRRPIGALNTISNQRHLQRTTNHYQGIRPHQPAPLPTARVVRLDPVPTGARVTTSVTDAPTIQTLSHVVSSWVGLSGLPAEQAAEINSEDWQLSPHDSENLKGFLEKMRGTKDFQSSPEGSAARVTAFIQAFNAGDTQFRDMAMGYVNDAMTDCHDRAESSMTELDLMVFDLETTTMVKEARSPDEAREILTSRAKGRMAHQITNEQNYKICRRRPGFFGMLQRKGGAIYRESIENHLDLMLRVKRKLTKRGSSVSLPIKTQNMLYARCSIVTRRDVTQTANKIERETSNPAKVASFMQSWQPAVEFERSQSAQNITYDSLTHQHDSPAHQDIQILPGDICILSQEPYQGGIENPVILNGNVYEWEALQGWLGTELTDPQDRSKAVTFGDVIKIDRCPEPEPEPEINVAPQQEAEPAAAQSASQSTTSEPNDEEAQVSKAISDSMNQRFDKLQDELSGIEVKLMIANDTISNPDLLIATKFDIEDRLLGLQASLNELKSGDSQVLADMQKEGKTLAKLDEWISDLSKSLGI